MTTTGYQAGVEANSLVISYGAETTWGTVPTVAFQAIREMSESLASTRTRSRPTEMNTSGEVSAAVTTKIEAGGTVNFALSYGTYDDWIASALDNVWGTTVTLAGVSADITITTATNILSSTTSNKFLNISAGQWIRLLGFTNAINNVIARVITKTDSTHLVLSLPYNKVTGAAAAYVTETPTGTLAQVRASSIINGTLAQTLTIQKGFSASLFLLYTGCLISQMTLSGGVGNFLTGAFTILAKAETNATTNASTGSVVAAPTGKVMDPIIGFGGFYRNEVFLAQTVDSFTLQIQSTGAALEFGMGNASAAGLILGLTEVSGTAKVYFKDFSIYTQFLAETGGTFEFIVQDSVGNAYVFTFLNAVFMNPQILAGGQNQAVMASFTLEGDPQAAGGTIQIDRLPAT